MVTDWKKQAKIAWERQAEKDRAYQVALDRAEAAERKANELNDAATQDRQSLIKATERIEDSRMRAMLWALNRCTFSFGARPRRKVKVEAGETIEQDLRGA